jgi:MYXO-CTERM domain-containing protein
MDPVDAGASPRGVCPGFDLSGRGGGSGGTSGGPDAGNGTGSKGGCGCTGSPAAIGAWWLLGLAVVRLSRRRVWAVRQVQRQPVQSG